MNFEEAHQAFIQHHLLRRRGERRNRLERGHAHAEKLMLQKVWWPLKGNFEHLHPEYEILDWRGYPYYADFAWLPGFIKLLIEVKGYKAHVQDMDRSKYSNELNRETFLYAMGFHVISFSYEDVEKRPDICIRLLRMVMSRYIHLQQPVSLPSLIEKELIRYAIQCAGEIRPIEVREYLDIDYKTAAKMLNTLCSKGWFIPKYGPDGKRVVKYKFALDKLDYLEYIL